MQIIPKKKCGLMEREELDGIVSIGLSLSTKKFLNSSGVRIYNLIDGKRHSDEICEIIKSKYNPSISERVKDDVVNFLFSLKNMGIIEWEERIDMDNGCTIIGEKQFEDVSKFICEFIKDKKMLRGFSASPDIKSFLTPNLRTRSLYNSEIFFAKYENNKIVAEISVVGLDNTFGTGTINTFIWEKEEDIEELFNSMSLYLKDIDCNKLKVILIKDNLIPDFDPILNNILFKIGFEKEATLKKENFGRDVELMSYFL